MNEIECVFNQWYDHVLLDGALLDPGSSQKVWNHSPDGFAWGYGGSGPAQLALAILLHVTGRPETSVRLHQDFKDEFIAGLPQGSCSFQVDVAAWVAKRTIAVAS